jgi:hypothetical protein
MIHMKNFVGLHLGCVSPLFLFIIEIGSVLYAV